MSPTPLSARLEALLADPRVPTSCAAFDADGTLWAGDVGEVLLQKMEAQGRAPPGSFERYLQLMATDAVEGCALCVRLLAGASVSELEGWSRELVGQGQHGPILQPVVELARGLVQRGCQVWIISGSNAWTVRIAAAALGLEQAGVLGVTGPLSDSVFTGAVDLPVTCRAGKVEALKLATQRPLLLAAGNAEYDLELLEQAEVRLAVGPLSRETALLRTASDRGWLTFRSEH